MSTVADRLAAKSASARPARRRRWFDWAEFGLIVGLVFLILFGIAWSVAMIWWITWSILDLANGNPATAWNILGIVIPAISLLSSVFKAVSK